MTDAAITVEELGKRYRLRTSPSRTDTPRVSPSRWAGLSKRFVGVERFGVDDAASEAFWALRDMSFGVARGEVLGVIGQNGSGKSTLLKILSGITTPTTGRADINGRMGSLLEVGTGFHPELSGRENTYLNGAILGIKKQDIKRRFDEIVAFAEVEKFIDTPVKYYSSGMYVRLAFAVAAHLEPEILLLDEVLAVGDVAFQRKCLGKMGAVARAGRTVIFVSHNLAAVRNLCGRTLWLDSGMLAKIGPTEEVISHYLSKTAVELSAAVTLPCSSPAEAGAGCVLRFMNAKRLLQAQFRLGEPWRIALEFELNRSVPHVIAAVGLISLEAVPLITYWSRPRNLGPGRYCVEFECDVPFAACEIQFAVGLSSYERPFYYVQGVGHVSISAVAVQEQPLRASGSGMLMSYRQSEIRPIVRAEGCAAS